MKAEIANLLVQASSIAVISHSNPDGDAIGSTLALAMGLAKKKKNVRVLGDAPLPDVYRFLPGRSLYQVTAEVGVELVVYLDCASRTRAATHPSQYQITVNIDHHADNTLFADYNWVDVDAAATGEMVYELLGELAVELDADMATCLYAAVASDTGWFAYENTRSLTHNIAADLIERGALPHLVSSRLQLGRRYAALKLLAHALLSMELLFEGKVSLMTLRQIDYERSQAMPEDANGIVQYGGMLGDVEVSILLKELEGPEVAVSLRSFGEVNVQRIASQLGGGGHVKAAGCTLPGDISTARIRLMETLEGTLRV